MTKQQTRSTMVTRNRTHISPAQ